MKKIVKNIPSGAFLVDILSNSSFEKEHIKGAKNLCAYEIAFLDKMQESYPKKEQSICIYGWSDKTEEANRAHHLLISAGYSNVSILEGGLEAWKTAGGKIEANDEIEKSEGIFEIDSEESMVEWKGRKVGKNHIGTILVKGGRFNFKEGLLKSGEVILDMNSILNKDLDQEHAKYLVKHLKSDDFFSVEKFPEAKLIFKETAKLFAIASRPNFRVKALLMIKGITREFDFEAFIHEIEGSVILTAYFDIDRTDWDVKYGSEKFFSKLGMHIVDDRISFDLNLIGKKK